MIWERDIYVTCFFKNDIYRKHREKLLLVLDLLIVLLSYLIAYWSKNDFQLRTVQWDLTGNEVAIGCCILLIVYTLCFAFFKVYKSLWKYIGVDELLRLTASNILAMIIVMFLSQLYFGMFSLISLELIAGVYALIIMSGVRVLYRLLRRYSINRDAKEVKTIVIGAGDAGNLLLRELRQNDSLNYKIVGFIDDFKKDLMIGGYPILGTTEDLKVIKEKYDVESALIAISHVNQRDLRRIYDECVNNGLDTKIMNFQFKNDTKNNSVVADIKIEDLLGRGEIHLEQNEISSYLTDQVVVVTGAGGSIGSELCRQISKFQPRKLIMIDINENSLYMLEQEFKRDIEHGKMSQNIDLKSLIASIRDKKAIDEIFDRYHPDVVYHAAAHKHVPLMETRPMEAIKNNVFGTNNVIHSCIEHKVKRFIMISTDKAVNPTNVMGATKRMTEMILQSHGHNGVTKMAAVRFGNVLGSNGSVIPIFKAQIAEGGPVTLTSKEIIRYFMTIPEAAQLVLQAGYYADQGDIFVLDMGEPVRILDLAEKMIRLAGLKPYEDIEIKEIGLRPGEKMFEELRLDGEDTTRTKNDLIYKNAPMNITVEDIDARLSQLHNVLYKEDVTPSEIKETILNLIISDKNS
ncbi:polysaccharide biosynthesis protein [Allocoprobacillus halotolerans]|uniref:Polysaccharide biosynthesis protein n=1 Tax=Allocoprobacillus halotolerans TaxID=2944914 RepID=A0ABY5HYF3_9FIRM|nr:nucleoside-diphosphate sugar epimerase/dehydratase [Allocoprobacillus halotolerans]UTY38079.1 polysaccharide biosynthesis protein [Allocoprobacillus halotolerans]